MEEISLIRFVGPQFPQKLEDFISEIKKDFSAQKPFAECAEAAHSEQTITNKAILCLKFYQLPQTADRQLIFKKIEYPYSFDMDMKDPKVIENVEEVMSEKLLKKVSDFIDEKILQDGPELKELISLKIKVLGQNPLAKIFEASVKIDWIEAQSGMKCTYCTYKKQAVKKNELSVPETSEKPHSRKKEKSYVPKSVSQIYSKIPSKFKTHVQGLFFMLIGALISGIFLRYRWLPPKAVI